MGKTLAEKVWDAHVVAEAEGCPAILYVDLHLVHEVTSPQAFESSGGGGRTHNLRINSPPLCRLSYPGMGVGEGSGSGPPLAPRLGHSSSRNSFNFWLRCG